MTGMGAADGLRQFLPDTVERQQEGRPAADQHIVMTGAKAITEGVILRQPDGLAQPPPDAIALDRVADLFRHGETDPAWTMILPVPGLQHKGGCRDLDARRRGQKIRALSQSLHCGRAVFPARAIRR
jgi:hypothetical protein